MLVKLQLDRNGTVTSKGWANPDQRKAGDQTDDGFTVYDLAEAEIDACVPYHTKLVNGHLVIDEDYVPPKLPEPQPDPDDEASAALAAEVANLKISNAVLAKQVASILANDQKESDKS